MFNIIPGGAKTFTFFFIDPQGVARPLASLPVVSDPNKILTFTPLNNPDTNKPQAVTDLQFLFQGSCPASAAIGTALEVDVTAEGDPTPGVRTIVGKYLGQVVAPNASQVNLQVT